VIWAWVLVVRWLTWGLDLAGQAGDAERSRDREGAVGGLASAGGATSGGAIPGLQGAGGIGGLLGADDANGTPGVTGDDEQYVLFYDAQGNVGQLVKDAVQPLGRYEYDAYGRTIGPDADGDGDWTDDAGPSPRRTPTASQEAAATRAPLHRSADAACTTTATATTPPPGPTVAETRLRKRGPIFYAYVENKHKHRSRPERQDAGIQGELQEECQRRRRALRTPRSRNCTTCKGRKDPLPGMRALGKVRCITVVGLYWRWR
jgi:hypothetical protein